MSRLHYLSGLIWVAVCLALLGSGRPADLAHGPSPAFGSGTGADGWFQAVKPYCNALEVDMAFRASPPPGGMEGAGFASACLALAGRIDDARAVILELPEADRYQAAGIVFEVGHPVADAGDDRSAGPIMGLVVEFWPNHYMALYHAGMADYATGRMDLARSHLTAFLENYQQLDGWHANAVTVLDRLAQGGGQ